MAYTGLQREKKPLLAHRMVRRYLLPTFVIGPALAFGLFNPSVAFAAEADGPDGAAAVAQPQVVYTEDIFSTNADFDRSVAETAATGYQAPVDQGYGQGSFAAEPVGVVGDEGYVASSEIAASDVGASSSYPEQFGQQSSDGGSYSQGVETAAAQQNNSAQEYIDIANNISRRTMSVGLTQQDDSEDITYYESHEATITFSAGEGGSITPIANAQQSQNTSSDAENTITEHYADSLAGVSNGARAVADEGFHFVKWIDLNNGNTLSTSENFIPDRPEEGWPLSWLIQAVFAPNVYQVRLDVNGGKSAGGGGSGGPITFDVVPGGNFKLPANGTEFTFIKVGSAFSGWNTAPNPAGATSSTPLAVEDGAVFDSELETWLQRLGWLKLDWSGGSEPVVTLYAQWVSGQSTITYKASEGGAISANAPASSAADNIATETINAASGMHFSDNSVFGPQGATANASSRHHFVVWDVTGSKEALADSEADNNVLSAGTATRIARYSEYSGIPEEYHPVTFTAQFAPNAYSFAYDGNGGSGSVASTDVTYGLSAQAASSGMTRSGYKLSGWNLDASGSGTSIALGQTIDDALLDSLISAGLLSDANGARATLYAQWTAESTPAQPDKPTPGPADGGNGGSGSGTDNPGGSGSQGGSGSDAGNGADNAADGAGSGSSGTGPENGSSAGTGGSNAVQPSSPVSYLFNGLGAFAISPVISAGTAEASNSVTTPNAVNSAPSAASHPAGKLAAAGRAASLGTPITISEALSGAFGNGNGDDALAKLASPEAMQAAGATVATVAAVGVVAGLVGVGVSVAGAAAAGAAVVGTSSAVALSTAADLAADLAASAAGAAGAAGAAAKRRKEEEEEAEEEAAEHELQA